MQQVQSHTKRQRRGGAKVGAKPEARLRLPSEERKRQIIDATLKLVATHGVQGTTLHRIAKEVGVTHPALYAHFEGRREILLAALDVVFERILEVHRAFTQDNMLERLRSISLYHTQLVASAADGFVSPLFEFLVASPDEGLRGELAARERVLFHDFAQIVREGQAQGTIKPDVDPEQVAFLITGRHWAEDVGVLMGIVEDSFQSRSMQWLDLIIDLIKMPEGNPNNPA
jgi:AcrR family transcriptional regulator